MMHHLSSFNPGLIHHSIMHTEKVKAVLLEYFIINCGNMMNALFKSNIAVHLMSYMICAHKCIRLQYYL